MNLPGGGADRSFRYGWEEIKFKGSEERKKKKVTQPVSISNWAEAQLIFSFWNPAA